MAQRFDPITQRFQLSGLDSLFQQNPANLASNLLKSGMSPQEVSLQTGVNLDELMLLQRDQMTNVPVQPPMATVPMNQTGGIASTLNRDIMAGDPTGELAMLSSQMVDQMDLLGLTKDEDTADALDGVVAAQINASAEKVQSAAASGDAGQLAQAQKDANDVTQLNTSIISFMGNTPEARKEKMNIYREAAATMLGGREDLEKFIRQPDEALPYMVAGMALSQSGRQGDDWITALTNAFSKYAVTKKQEDRAFQDRFLQFKLNEQARKEDFAVNLALKDLDIQASQITEKGTPYIVNGDLQILNPMEARKISKTKGINIRPYDKEVDGVVSDYTITGQNGSSVTQLLTNSEAKQLQDLGFGVVTGNLNKDKKQYQIIYPPDYTPKVGSRLENMPSFINLSESEIQAIRKEFPDVDFSDKKVDLVPILRNINGVPTPMLIPETQVNYKTDQRQYASGLNIEFGPDGKVTGITSGSGNNERSLNKDRRRALKEFRDQATDTAQTYTLLDDIMKVVDGGAQLPAGARGFTNIVQRGIDELKALGKNFVDIATATNDVLNFTDTTFKGADGTAITARQLFNDFSNSPEYAGLLGTNVNNREYQALTFNLAVSLAKAMGLGEARALSDRDLVFAMRTAGFDSSNRESLMERHKTLRKQLLRNLFQEKLNIEADVYLIGDDKFVKGLDAIINNPIDPLNPDVTFASLYKSFQNEPDDMPQDTLAQSATTTQTVYSPEYSNFFSNLDASNLPSLTSMLSKKVNEVSKEPKATQDKYFADLGKYMNTLPQDIRETILTALEQAMQGE
tara:strand:+ start:9707 stop:12103 length:2397 start_codon:yes stop_codon:yes gene_type:complete